MRIARRAHYKRTAWKNGEGLTEEVMAFPEGSDVGSFDWRVSIAHVGADGPFSVFARIDRTIALLDGSGMVLDLPEGRRTELIPSSGPFSFSGDWEVYSRNLDGPTVGLNVMTRRGRWTHKMQRLTLMPANRFVSPEFACAVFKSPANIKVDGRDYFLDAFDSLIITQHDAFDIMDSHSIDIFLISLFLNEPPSL